MKNIDDLLVSGHDIKEIKPLIRKILKIYSKKNIKIKLSKFEISQKVTSRPVAGRTQSPSPPRTTRSRSS